MQVFALKDVIDHGTIVQLIGNNPDTGEPVRVNMDHSCFWRSGLAEEVFVRDEDEEFLMSYDAEEGHVQVLH